MAQGNNNEDNDDNYDDDDDDDKITCTAPHFHGTHRRYTHNPKRTHREMDQLDIRVGNVESVIKVVTF